MKRILFIFPLEATQYYNKSLHFDWILDCAQDYIIDMWGKGYGSTSADSLKEKTDSFKPDFIYMTIRKRYFDPVSCDTWLPDLTCIKITKIFVECDEWANDRKDKWYDQFDKIYCRQPIWKFKYSVKLNFTYFLNKKIKKPEKKYSDYESYINNIKSWKNIPLFRWSVPEKAFMFSKKHKKGIYFVGQCKGPYDFRKQMRIIFRKKGSIIFIKAKMDNYWKLLGSTSALVCPTESNYGDFVPAKIFEYAASGAAILTNCDLISYNMPDLDKVVIKYTDLNDLEEKLKMDFTSYYGKAREVIKNHTHKIRYKELFGE